MKERDYSYVAMKPAGLSDRGKIKGVILAKNTSEAINQLRNMGYLPIEVKIG